MPEEYLICNCMSKSIGSKPIATRHYIGIQTFLKSSEVRCMIFCVQVPEDLWTKCEGVVYKYLNDCAALFVKCRKLSKFNAVTLDLELIC